MAEPQLAIPGVEAPSPPKEFDVIEWISGVRADVLDVLERMQGTLEARGVRLSGPDRALWDDIQALRKRLEGRR